MSFHRVRAQRSLQLRGDAASGQKPRRAAASPAPRRILTLNHAQVPSS